MPVARYSEWKDEYPEFTPNVTPERMFRSGAFGGTYFREIESQVTGKTHRNRHLRYDWAKDMNPELLTRPWEEYDKSINKFGVKVGETLEFWEDKGWIKAQDPYGWAEWWCRFYDGRRSRDDERQIKRWLNTAGPNSRFRKRLINMIIDGRRRWDDASVSPKIHQVLWHWGVALTPGDVERVRRERSR